MGSIGSHNDMEKIATAISKKSGIKASVRDIQTVLSAALSYPNIWSIVRHARVPIRVVLSVVSFLKEQNYLLESEESVLFNDKGKEFLTKHCISALVSSACKECSGRGVLLQKDNFYDRFMQIYTSIPRPTFEFNQGSVMPESTIARVNYALSRNDVENKEILILGAEDDLIGLALALTKKPKKVVVLDIDQRLIDIDNRYAKELDLPLEAYCFDLRKPLPKKWLQKFDTFITEPPESIPAFRGFVMKGFSALKGPGSVGYFGYTLADSSLYKWHKIQKMLIQHNLVISDILPDFIRYLPFPNFLNAEAYKASPIKSKQEHEWYFSHWYRVVALEGFFGYNDDVVKKDESLYFDKEIISD